MKYFRYIIIVRLTLILCLSGLLQTEFVNAVPSTKVRGAKLIMEAMTISQEVLRDNVVDTTLSVAGDTAIHVLEGCTVQYSTDTTYQFSDYLFIKDGIVVRNDTSLTAANEHLVNNILTQGTYQFIVREKNENGDILDSVFSKPLIVWTKPSAVCQGMGKGTQESYEVVWKGQRHIEFQSSGGYPNGWSYSVMNNSKQYSDSKVTIDLDAVTNNEPAKYVVRYSVSNSGPDGKVWYSSEDSCFYNVWSRPNSSYSQSSTDVVTGTSVTFSVKTNAGDASSWKYLWDTGENNSEYIFTATKNNMADYEDISHTVSVSNEPEGMDPDSVYKVQFSPTVRVFKTPSVQKNVWGSGTKESPLYIWSRETRFQIGHEGGNPNGWTTSITLDNNKVYSDNSIIDLKGSSTDTPLYHEVAYKGTNRSPNNNGLWLDTTFVCAFNVWDYPTVNLKGSWASDSYKDGSVHVYDSTEIILNSKVSGGQNGKWVYMWNEDSNESSDSFKTVVRSGDIIDGYNKLTYKLQAVNNADFVSPFDSVVNINVTVYPKISITISDDDPQGLSENNIDLGVVPHGGYPNWNCECLLNGEGSNKSVDGKTCVVKPINSGKTSIQQQYLVRWHNIGPDAKTDWDVIEKWVTLTVFPTALPPVSEITEIPTIRDVDSTVLLIQEGLYGYEDGWHYAWESDDNGVLLSPSDDSLSCKVEYHFDSNYPAHKFIPVNLKYSNIKKDNAKKVALSGTINFYVQVFNTPKTPGSLKRKGNGNSNIYIITDMNIKDDSLFTSKYNYSFVFGNADDVDGVEESQRWHKYSTTPTEPWVRSRWIYTNPSFECLSDKCYLDTDDTRIDDDISGINTIEYAERTNKLYTLSGRFVCHIPGVDHVDDYSLPKGVYILWYTECGELKSRKVTIK